MSQTNREQLRAELHLVPVSKQDEGVSWSRISNGVFGFTYTPANNDGGIFAKETYQSFELHKLSDGTLQIVGFTTPEGAEKVKGPGSPDVEVYPAPSADHDVLVVIPQSRISAHKPLDKNDANKLKLTLRPA
jgi:hypothetical protein